MQDISVADIVLESYSNPSINLHKVLQTKTKEELIEFIVNQVKSKPF